MDKSRQQFEEEFTKRTALDANDIFKIDDNTGEYYFMTPRQAWYWWQASRESLEIELPDSKYGSEGYKGMIELFRNILISNGVKIKNE